MMTPRPSHTELTVAVDLAILTVVDGSLRVHLVKRPDAHVAGWAMPGGFVHAEQSLDDTVHRILAEKTGIRSARFEQLATYGAVDRDPRRRVISVAYLALCPDEVLMRATEGRTDAQLAGIQTDWQGLDGGPAKAFDAAGKQLNLAFDHAEILGDLVKRLRGKLDYSTIAFGLLPRRFTLLDVQIVHEAILGQSRPKPAFRRKLLARGVIRPTGKFTTTGAHRPAELFELMERR